MCHAAVTGRRFASLLWLTEAARCHPSWGRECDLNVHSGRGAHSMRATFVSTNDGVFVSLRQDVGLFKAPRRVSFDSERTVILGHLLFPDAGACESLCKVNS